MSAVPLVKLRDLIRSLAQQATVIISTHILQEVQAICDRVIILRNGRKALDATMAELRAGKRLLVAVDGGPERALDLFKAVDGIQSVEQLDGRGPGHRYALDLGGRDELADTAPEVASRAEAEGWKLYALQPGSRDLETIFGEISAQDEPGLEVKVARKDGAVLTYRSSKPEDASYYVLKRPDFDRYFKVAEFTVKPIKDTLREKLVQAKVEEAPSEAAGDDTHAEAETKATE